MPTTTGLATSFITFSRPGASGGGATVTDRDGRIKWAGHNLLTNSESFDAASWTKGNIVTTGSWINAGTAPNGATTADLIRPSTVSTNHYVVSGSLIGGGTFTHAIFVRANGYTKFALRESAATGAYASFDTSTVSVLDSASAGAVTVSSPQITPIGGDWFLVTVKFAVPFGVGNGFGLWVLPDSYTTGDPTGTNWSGDGTKGIYVWGAHVFRNDLGGMQLNPSMPAGMQSYYPTTPRNLLGFTEDFSGTGWTRVNLLANGSGSVANAAVAPNGLQTADLLIESTANGYHSVYRSFTCVSGTPYLWSAYVKPAGRTIVQIAAQATGNVHIVEFNLTGSGTATTRSGSGTAAITALSDGWYRISTIATATASGTAYWQVDICSAANTNSYTGDGVNGIYLWGAQLSDSASLDTYVPQYGAAVTSAAYYAPRLDFDGATLSPKGLLVEEQRTNTIVNSSVFSGWNKATATVLDNQVSGPDGSVTAGVITATAANGEIYTQVTSTSGVAHTGSIYVKRKTGTGSVYLIDAAAARILVTASITTENWTRISVTANSVSVNPFFGIRLATSGDELYIWGAQLEAGSFATSYIPNGSAVAGATRTADVASVSTQAFPYSATEGTYVVSFVPVVSDANSVVLSITDSSASNRIYTAGAASEHLVIASSGTPQVNLDAGSVTVGAVNKVGAAFAANNFAAVINGGTAATSTSGLMPVGVLNMSIGNYNVSGTYRSYHIRQVTYLPRRISNAELQSRTA